MSFIGCDIEGIEELIADFKGYEKEAQSAIRKAISDTAKDIETDAKWKLAGQFGHKSHTVHGGAGLLGSIYNRVAGPNEKVVGTAQSYAPYIEFGNGDPVFTNFDFTEEEKYIAAQFKGQGIRKVNIKGGSFLAFAAAKNQKKLAERIETNLNKIAK